MAEPTKNETPKKPEEAKASVAAAQPKKKMDSGLKVVLIVVGVLFGLGILAAVALMVFVGSVFHHAAKNVQVNGTGENGSVTIKSSDGQSSATYGTGAKLPTGFPTDIPIYKPSTLVSSSKTGEGSYSASAKTSDSVDKVTSYYRDALAGSGWSSVHESSYQDGTIMDFKKDNRSLVVSVSNQKDEQTDKTYISLSTTTQQ